MYSDKIEVSLRIHYTIPKECFVLSDKNFVIALDAGGGGAKCAVLTTEGRIIGDSIKEWNRKTWDPKTGWDAFKSAIRDVLERTHLNPSQILAVSSTAFREDIVLINSEGEEIPFSTDKRIFDIGKDLQERFGEEIYQRSGHWPVAPLMPPPKLLWLKKYKPNLFNKVSKMLMASNWILYKLTGEYACEPSNAGSSCLFDVFKGDWNWNVINEIGLPEEIFPKVLNSSQILGKVSQKASFETGLAKGTLVIMGGADAQCGVLGSGGVDIGDTVAVGGTTTPILMVTDAPIIDRKRRTWFGNHVISGKFFLESNAGITGWAYRWFRDNFAELETMTSKVVCTDAYEFLNREVEAVPVGHSKVLAFLGSTIMDQKKLILPQGAIVGLETWSSEPTKKAEIARAVIESTCYAIRANCLQIENIAKKKIEKLGFCGGNSRSQIWCQILADILGRPVMVPESKDSTTVGVGLCASVGGGKYSNLLEAEKVCVKTRSVNPVQENVKIYDSLYVRWRKVYDKILEISKLLDN